MKNGEGRKIEGGGVGGLAGVNTEGGLWRHLCGKIRQADGRPADIFLKKRHIKVT